MVKFRKKTRRKLKRKSKQSIKGGGNRFHCYTKEQLEEVKRDAIADHINNKRNRRVGRKEKRLQQNDDWQDYLQDDWRYDPPPLAPQLERQESLNMGVQGDDEGNRKRKQDSPKKEKKKRGKRGVAPDMPGGSKKRKRRKQKKTRKARGIIDDLRELCTTGRCGSPRPQTPTLRQVALTIEQNILDDLNKNEPEIALTSEQRRNIKALANKQAADIVNNSRSRRS
jgi:hypothetical protein